jgi:hypothetical protein
VIDTKYQILGVQDLFFKKKKNLLVFCYYFKIEKLKPKLYKKKVKLKLENQHDE